MANFFGSQIAKNCCSMPTRPKPACTWMSLSNWTRVVLGFADRRHFGRVHYWESVDACPSLKVLGIDALSSDFTANRLAKLLATSKRPLKDFLLDQSRIAGLGNIYSCESLWHARLDPRRRAKHLATGGNPPPCTKQLCPFSRRALECLLASGAQFSEIRSGGSRDWRVFFACTARKGKPCRRCGEPISAQGRRAAGQTYYCGRCQEISVSTL